MVLNFESYSHKAYAFLNDVATELQDTEDKERVGRVLKAVLQALREVITPEESLHLISQLPLYIKAVYVENWKISGNPKKIGSLDELLKIVREKTPRTAGRDFGNDEEAIQKIKAVFKVLSRHVSSGEIGDVKVQLTQSIAELWDGQEMAGKERQQ